MLFPTKDIDYSRSIVTTISTEETENEKYWDMDESSTGDIELASSTFEDGQYLKKIEKLKEADNFIENIKEKSISEGFPEYIVASKAEELWLDLQSEYGELIPVPVISLGIDGSILFTIRKQQHYFELEVVETGIELYYENEKTEETDFEELDFGLSIIDEAEKWLVKIASSN